MQFFGKINKIKKQYFFFIANEQYINTDSLWLSKFPNKVPVCFLHTFPKNLSTVTDGKMDYLSICSDSVWPHSCSWMFLNSQEQFIAISYYFQGYCNSIRWIKYQLLSLPYDYLENTVRGYHHYFHSPL